MPLFDDDAADMLFEELSNPENFGMAKSFVMAGNQAGFDMSTQQGLEAFMLAYNSAMLTSHLTKTAEPEPPRQSILHHGRSVAKAQKSQSRREKRKRQKTKRHRRR